MKTYIILVLCFMSISLFSFAQEKYQPFILAFTKNYNNKWQEFQRESDKALKDYKNLKQGIIDENKELNKYNYIFIPELLLRKSKNLYKIIDSTNLVQYFDPQSVFYHRTLVSADSLYIGDIISLYTKSVKNEFTLKPNVNNFIFEQLYKKLAEINPDMVFTVQNIEGYFFIKEKNLYVLNRERANVNFQIYSIDEYTDKFKRMIFSTFFHYVPRMKYIICY